MGIIIVTLAAPVALAGRAATQTARMEALARMAAGVAVGVCPAVPGHPVAEVTAAPVLSGPMAWQLQHVVPAAAEVEPPGTITTTFPPLQEVMEAFTAAGGEEVAPLIPREQLAPAATGRMVLSSSRIRLLPRPPRHHTAASSASSGTCGSRAACGWRAALPCRALLIYAASAATSPSPTSAAGCAAVIFPQRRQ